MGNTYPSQTGHSATVLKEQSLVSSNTQDSTVILTWYDPKMNSDFEHEKTKRMISKVTNNVLFYVLETEFLNYIETDKHTSVVLIVSGHVARDILIRVNHLRYIQSVHIYCDGYEKTKYQSLKTDFRPKVKSISSERYELRLALETTLNYLNAFSYYNTVSQRSTWDLSTSNTEFIWFQLLQQKLFLEQDIHTTQSKFDFIQRCREYLGDDYEADQKYLNYLENQYRPKDSIREYTKCNFLHNLINHAIRNGDAEELYHFRYYVAHLCTNLAKLSQRFRRKQGKTVLTLYRGQQLLREEGERLRISGNKYIAMRGFLSTTLDRKVAEAFAESSPENLPVLFEITVDLDQVPSMILADISKYSKYPDEKETLFGLNATFEIDEQFQGDCGRWIIKMHATNFEQKIVNDYIQYLQSKTSYSSSSSSISINFILAQFLIEMGENVKAVKFLEKMIPTTDDERANLYFILADAKISSYHLTKHALDEEIRLLKKSEELFISLDNKLGQAHTFRRYADAQVLNETYDEAVHSYQRAKQLYKEIPDQKENILSCYNGLADIYLVQRKYTKAKIYYMHVLKQRQTHLSDEHPATARSYYSLGRYYYLKGNNNDNALNYVKKALELKKKIYPSNHPSIQCNERLLKEMLAALAR
ncbi:unnamed protein product [Rotaria sp. Silwood2]|nr:unnamed protein product [Rotaria sp. Silwood2]